MNYLKVGLMVSMVSVMIVSCGSDETREQEGPVIQDVSVISTSSDRLSLVGRKVELSDAVVHEVVGNYVFWIGASHSGVPVARLDKIRGPVVEHVQRGGRARISGTIRLLEAVSATDPLWDRINDQEKNDMLAARIYIAAEQVMVVR